jgi:hypothetical protein
MRMTLIAALIFLGSCAEVERQKSDTPIAQPARYSDGRAYASAIRSTIRSNLVIPREVPGTATVTFSVVVTEAGMVSTMERMSTSGSVPYEEAVRRAILQSQPLPLLGPAGSKQLPLELVFHARE